MGEIVGEVHIATPASYATSENDRVSGVDTKPASFCDLAEFDNVRIGVIEQAGGQLGFDQSGQRDHCDDRQAGACHGLPQQGDC